MKIRVAGRDDVTAIVALLADDELGQRREGGPLRTYLEAFEAIDADPRNLLVVAEDCGEVVATLQLTFMPSLSHQGGERAQIEAVRVAGSRRTEGIGRVLVGWAVERARERGCRVVQLMSDRTRGDAHRFYESMGFVASHVGMKLDLR